MFDRFDLIEDQVIVWALFAPGLLRPAMAFSDMEDFKDFLDQGIGFYEENAIKTPEYIKAVFGDR